MATYIYENEIYRCSRYLKIYITYNLVILTNEMTLPGNIKNKYYSSKSSQPEGIAMSPLVLV